MSRPPAPSLDAAPGMTLRGIAAVIGVVLLCVLLAALLGLAGRRRALLASSAMETVLGAEADADMTWEPWLEWVAVPAPWRNGRLLPRRHAARRVRQRGVRPCARMRGPPGLIASFQWVRTGMA